MQNLGYLSLLIYTVMLIGVEKYRMYALPLAGIGLLLVYLKKKKISMGSGKIIFFYMGILGAGYLFNFLSQSGKEGAEFFLVINSIFLFAFIFLNFIETPKQLSFLRDILIWAGGVLGFLCVGEYISHYMRLAHKPELLVFYRAGAFEKYFYSGVLLMAIGTVGTARLYLEKIKWETWEDKIKTVITIASMLGIFQGLLLTKTRSAIYTFVLGYILILLYRFHLKKALVFLAVIISVYMLNPDHVKKFSETVTVREEQKGYRQESDNQRRVMAKIALETWKSSPIIGVGNDIKVVKKHLDQNSFKFQNEEGYIAGSMKGDDFRKRFTESHNMYLNILAQNGMLLILYLALFFYAIPELFYKNCKNIKELFLIKKIGSHKIDTVEYLKNEDLKLYDSINAGAMVGIINLLIIGLAWDVWGWAFQVQEIFQYLLMFMMAVGVHIRKTYDGIKSDKEKIKIIQGRKS